MSLNLLWIRFVCWSAGFADIHGTSIKTDVNADFRRGQGLGHCCRDAPKIGPDAMTDTARQFTRGPAAGEPPDVSTSSAESVARAIVDALFYARGTLPEPATQNDWYLALAQVVRDLLIDRWVATARTQMK